MENYKEELEEEIKLDDKVTVKRLWDSLSLNLAAILIGIVINVYLGTKNIWFTLFSIIVVIFLLKFGKDLFIKLRHLID